MDLWAAVRWWEESQLRFLVLSSLLQLFLFFLAPYRTFRLPSILRPSIWLAYLASLFNRHKLVPADGSILEVGLPPSVPTTWRTTSCGHGTS
ncbi:hypothetical protein ACP4OV_025225 [Aristida adscensionis]